MASSPMQSSAVLCRDRLQRIKRRIIGVQRPEIAARHWKGGGFPGRRRVETRSPV